MELPKKKRDLRWRAGPVSRQSDADLVALVTHLRGAAHAAGQLGSDRGVSYDNLGESRLEVPG